MDQPHEDKCSCTICQRIRSVDKLGLRMAEAGLSEDDRKLLYDLSDQLECVEEDLDIIRNGFDGLYIPRTWVAEMFNVSVEEVRKKREEIFKKKMGIE